MSKLPHVNSYKDLIVYKKSVALAREIYEVTKSLPADEKYSLTSQVRRSSRSIGAQIAESWGKRRYEKHFISKLTDADSEQYETQHWINIAFDCGYINQETARLLDNKCKEIGRLLGDMMTKSYYFCTSTKQYLKESSLEYFYNNPNNSEDSEF